MNNKTTTKPNRPKSRNEYFRRYRRNMSDEQKARVLDYARRYRVENREILKAKAQEKRANMDPVLKAAKYSERAAVRRSPLGKGCLPKGYKIEDTFPIFEEVVQLRNETGLPFEVDHITPIALNIPGLHCLENLQIVLAHQNRVKQHSIDRIMLRDDLVWDDDLEERLQKLAQEEKHQND